MLRKNERGRVSNTECLTLSIGHIVGHMYTILASIILPVIASERSERGNPKHCDSTTHRLLCYSLRSFLAITIYGACWTYTVIASD